MKKLFVLSFVCVLTISCITSFASAQDKFTIAMVPKALDNPIFVDAREAAKKASKELGVEFIWTASQKADAAEQVAVIESLIQKKVDAISISVNDPTALKDVINKAVETGILVSTFDSDSPESNRLFYLGTDNYGGGMTCGKLMIDLLGGKGRVAILTGVIGAFNLEERIRGFKDAIKDTEIEVVTILACDDDINKSVELVNTYTMANTGNFEGWFFDGGWPLFVPVDTLEPINNFPGKVVSFDTFPPMLLHVKEGGIDALVGQNYEVMGRKTIEILVKLLKGEMKQEEVEEIMFSGFEFADKQNIDELIAKKGTTW